MSSLVITIEATGLAIAANIPVLLWGPPGTGKTSAVVALADQMDLPCEVVIASIREPSDFAGLPIVAGADSSTPHVNMAPPSWAMRLAKAKAGVLFLDEISTAPPAVQAALLRVVLERSVGDLALPSEVAVVAAANPPEQAADGWDLSAPLANRFCHLDWPVDARAFADGLISGFPRPSVPVISDSRAIRLAATKAFVSGFVMVRPGLVCAVPADAATAGRGWPSPRSWEAVARLLAVADLAGASVGARSALVRGCVGEAAGIEFLTWLNEADLPDPEMVLSDPDSFELPLRGDRAYAVLAAVAGAVAADNTIERWAAGWQVLGRAAKTAPDIAATAARILATCRPPGAMAPKEAAEFAPLLRDAGLL